MKYARRLALIPAALAVLIMTFSCSDTEHRIPIGSARVVINMGLPPETPDAELGLIERIRRLFVPDAIAQSAPAAFSSILVRVTGADIGAVEESFGPYSTISMNVPAGTLRVFEVTAIVAPGDPSAAASFKGTASANCPAGQTVNVPVVMGLNETKIVVPDPFDNIFYSIRRLIQINDMTGAGWTEIQGSDIGFAGTFRPWAVDFDARGRIYIANNAGAGSDVVIRINNMNDPACVTLGDGSNNPIVAVAVDRIRNHVYYATNPLLLKRCNLDGTNDITLATTIGVVIETITGLDIGSEWNTIYFRYDNGSRPNEYSVMIRYCSRSRRHIQPYLDNPSDVEVRFPYIYVANAEGDNYKILQLSSDLQYVAGYGSQALVGTNTNPGMFYDPRRFVGIRNNALIIIDDYSPSYDYDKLVSLQGMNGIGWTTYGSEGKGTGQFQFFYGC